MPGSVLAEGDAPAMSRPRKYELRERAVRLVFESKRPIAHVAQDLGVHKESLRHWVRQAEADSGRRPTRSASAHAVRPACSSRRNSPPLRRRECGRRG